MKQTIIIIFYLFMPAIVCGQSLTATLVTLTDFAPYCFNKEGGMDFVGKEIIAPGDDSSKLQGYSWDVVRESFHQMGYTIVLYVVPWERAIHYLKSDRVDAIFPANRTKEREELYKFSDEYVDRTRLVVYVPMASRLEWHGLKSLNKLRVGAVRGWAYGKKWESNGQIIKESMDSIIQSFKVLEKGRVDAVVGYEIAYDYVLKSNGLQDHFRKIGYFDVIDEYLMVKKGNQKALKITADFDHGHRKLEKDGDLKAIEKRWQ